MQKFLNKYNTKELLHKTTLNFEDDNSLEDQNKFFIDEDGINLLGNNKTNSDDDSLSCEVKGEYSPTQQFILKFDSDDE